MHAGYPMIDNMLTLLQANSHVYVDVAGLIWSYPLKEVNRYIERLVDAGFEDRVMFGTDQLIWPKLMAIRSSIVQNADYLTPNRSATSSITTPRVSYASIPNSPISSRRHGRMVFRRNSGGAGPRVRAGLPRPAVAVNASSCQREKTDVPLNQYHSGCRAIQCRVPRTHGKSAKPHSPGGPRLPESFSSNRCEKNCTIHVTVSA